MSSLIKEINILISKGIYVLLFKANKSVYKAKSKQRYYKTFNNILLHVPNHALKDVYMLNYRTIKNTNSSYYTGFFMVSGKMPPGKKPPGKMPPRKLPPGNKPPKKIAPRKKAPRKNAPQENCPPEKCPPENYFTRFLLLLTLSYSSSFSNFL